MASWSEANHDLRVTDKSRYFVTTDFNSYFIQSPSLFFVSYLISLWQLMVREAICHFSSLTAWCNYARAEYYLQQNTFRQYYAWAENYFIFSSLVLFLLHAERNERADFCSKVISFIFCYIWCILAGHLIAASRMTIKM